MTRNYVTTVRPNDTLESIAHRFTGSPNRWAEIVAVNNYLPKKTKLINGQRVSTLSNLFIGQNITLPNHWFVRYSSNPYTWNDLLKNNGVTYGSYITVYNNTAMSKIVQYAQGGPTLAGPFVDRIINRWDKPISVIAEYYNHPEWKNTQSVPFIPSLSDDKFWIWFLKQMGITFNTPEVVCLDSGGIWNDNSHTCHFVPPTTSPGSTSGAIGCGINCSAYDIAHGQCAALGKNQIRGAISGPPDGSLGSSNGQVGSSNGQVGCGGNRRHCGDGYMCYEGCSDCDYPFENAGNICPAPYGTFGAISGSPENGQVGCGQCGRFRGDMYLTGTVGADPTVPITLPSMPMTPDQAIDALIAAAQEYGVDLNQIVSAISTTISNDKTTPADCEKKTAEWTDAIIKRLQSDTRLKPIYDALVKHYGTEDELRARILIIQQAGCNEPLKNINVQAPYKNTTGLLWLGGTLLGGIIGGVVIGKIL